MKIRIYQYQLAGIIKGLYTINKTNSNSLADTLLTIFNQNKKVYLLVEE